MLCQGRGAIIAKSQPGLPKTPRLLEPKAILLAASSLLKDFIRFYDCDWLSTS